MGSLLAVLATGCQPASAPDAPATAVSGTGPDLMENSPGMMAEHDHMAMPAAAAGQGPYAQAMRLHDAAMNRMDALAAERQRLAGALAQLGQAAPTDPRWAARLRRAVSALEAADGQMMNWMHNAHEPDSTSHSGAQVAAYWQQQLPVLRQIDQRTTAALDSARVLR
ncbi:hypothetical protein BEN49_23210 [Hymenobacter coccineus]|uniref:Uncharacterized protein n=1 Tax=Hymenobacter coccineus TaxID=1908235 RepID=A0A1G1THI8_9BACT|nr:hypothetical protein BEN49_23210 [Hymenobacter coccineus]